MAKGIRDKVAILGMGCSNFGERWNDNAEDLMVESFSEALKDAGIEKTKLRRPGFQPPLKNNTWENPAYHSRWP